jgi:fructose-bisphosphate aldolase class 1
LVTKSKKIRPPKKSQIERFKEKARELAVDESGESMERAFKKIAMAKKSNN